MIDERSAGSFSKTGNDVDYPRRQADVGQPIRHLQHGKRRLLGGLQHTGATGRQGWRKFPGSHQQRVIPGNDLAGNAYGFFHGQAECVVRHGIHIAEDLRSQAAVVFETSGDVGDVIFGFDYGLAGIATLQFGKHGGFLANALGKLK